MQATQPNDTVLYVDGIIQRVDALAREVTVLTDGVQMLFDVPADCAVLLCGERVKLRLLQPLDHAVVAYSPRQSPPAARVIEVMNWS
jgi:hypothetical protein